MSLPDCCRLCLKDLADQEQDGDEHFFLTETIVGERLLQHLIEECFEILFTETESVTKVCTSCCNEVQFVDKIRTRVRVADAAVKKYYSQLDVKPDVEFLEELTSLPGSSNDLKDTKVEIEDFSFEDSAPESPGDLLSEDEHFKKFKFVEIEDSLRQENTIMKEELPDENPEDDKVVKPKKHRRIGSTKVVRKKPVCFTCYICTTDFETLVELDNHLPSHVGTVSQTCSLCNEELTTVRHLNMHLQRTHYRKGKRIPCYQCEIDGVTREFSSNYKLQDHIKRVHEGIVEVPERKFVCTYCGKNFSRGTHLRQHENIHTKSVVFSCKHCSNFTATSRSALLRHERIHTAEKPFKCDLCDAQFNQSNGLSSHKVNVHNQDRPFFCELCGEDIRFKTKYTLRVHMRTHEKKESGKIQRGPKNGEVERPPDPELKCNFCPAVYYKEIFLCKHILAKHPTESVPMIPCELCAEQNKKICFLTAKEKESHISYHTRVSRKTQKERACKDCGKVFPSSTTLARHRQTHFSNDCKKCGKSYKGRAGLRLHYLSVHFESRPYKCDKCDAAYGQLQQLTAHIKNHHQ